MPRLRRRSLAHLALGFALVAAAPSLRADDGATPPAQPPAQPPGDQLFEQVDRRKIMSMKLPRNWKAVSGEDINPNALAQYHGFFGEEGKSQDALVEYYSELQFSRATLARALILPQNGKVKAESLRQGPGWCEGASFDDRHLVIWERFVEKAGRVYRFRAITAAAAYDAQHAAVEKWLDSATVPGEAVPAPLGAAFVAKKSGEWDVLTDADADRKSSLEKAVTMLSQVRELMSKTLGGKPFDTSRPVAWVFQNSSKFDDRVKASLGSKAEFAAFDAPDRCAMVTIMSETAQGRDEAVYSTGAQHYVWQHFGGIPPIWVNSGLSQYGKIMMLCGGKKLPPDVLTKAKTAVVSGKRKLDQWFDVATWNEVTDNDQGLHELFAWHCYFRLGRGAKKYKKQYEGYLQSLRDTGDPAVARKAFDGVNFDEMLQDFRSWVAEWK